jgi:hypothetical protein
MDRAPTDTRSIAADERGAIMVMGICLCCLLVAGLWYLAGLGDAMIYRERAQEAADATAFTSAAVHAKGMNLIVLLNIVMALILSIRVILKALLLVEIIAEVVFSLSCLNPFGGEVLCALAPEVGTAIEWTTTAINDTRQPINDALKGLSEAEKVVARVIPPAAIVASAAVGNKYTPWVQISAAAAQPALVTEGLPVVDGTAQKLCYEAGFAVGDMLKNILDKVGLSALGAGADWIGSRIGDMAKSDPAFFCELPGSSPPQNNSDLNDATSKACQNLAAEAADGGASDPDAQAAINQFGGNDNFDESKCEKGYKDQAGQKMAGAGGTTSAGEWSKMLPRKLKPSYGNGCPANESLGLAEGNSKKIGDAPKAVAIGYLGDPKSNPTMSVSSLVSPIAGVLPEAFTQSEFFYDCAGKWGAGACNADGEDAMWHFKWRPRLVLFDNSHELFKVIADALAVGYDVQMTADRLPAIANVNKALVGELEKASADQKHLFIH